MSDNNSPTAAAPTGTERPQEPGQGAAAETTAAGANEGDGSVAPSTSTVAESIFESRLENGRTYHKYKDGKYWAPNDDTELDRLGMLSWWGIKIIAYKTVDVVHNLYLLTFDYALGTAPPNDENSKVGRVLDAGTGTGIWAIEFGEGHTDAEVIGVDLSPSQPQFVPSNVRFEIDDIEEPWTFNEPFDYIHSRMMKGSIRDWKKFIQSCFDNLTPGGYLELNDIDFFPKTDDDTIPKDSKLMRAFSLCFEALEKLGSPFEEVNHFESMLTEIGFEDVNVKRFKWPTNPWPQDKKYKKLGEWNNENLSPNLDGLLMAPLTRALDMSKAEVHVIAMEARKELNNPSIHAYFNGWSIYGRKPLRTGDSQPPAA
ncbi:putative methyltransferase tdiE [Colletotrichum gloeosporioides]|uniref:Putative methyltransferase tdiE n=1 Tax=Colletotrichum gloeosporioides TaxID=474922 RepID=A0A8H4FEG7_COLGL|nr:putative methyltransferase tdiE [Colletotrichum gloeosporioides]KAF3798890.1 putative methyltransferase tdiE [Colletotrichum gloeosporioides]